jgi:hypothetical protein
MAALAAGVASSMAQSNVYSLNVVGYVNYPFQSGLYTLVSNPLDNTTNDLNTVFPSPPDGTSVAFWSTAIQDFSTVSPQYFSSTHTWIPDSTVSPGQGFFVIPNGNFTNTYVGTVRQNAITNSLTGGGLYECIGATPPIGGSVTNVLQQYPPHDGDSLAIWNVGIQDFSTTAPQYFSSTGKWIPDYNFSVGDGFFIIRNAGPVTYVNQFTVP